MILFAWAIEVSIGWPERIFKIIKHPVVWIGGLISILDRTLNHTHLPHVIRYMAGVFATFIVVGFTAAIAYGLHLILPETEIGFSLEAIIISSLIASRSLYEHVSDVAKPMRVGDIDNSRKAISKIVGRDPSQLDSPAIARASLESMAENSSDGVIAPLFYGLIFGLPGIAAYKAVNTLDSMIGHRNARYLAFGGFAARLDDVVNFVPARLTGLLFSLSSLSIVSLKTMLRDARRHRSPNAGWPESAVAGALGVRLSGPRRYGDEIRQEPWLNREAPDPLPTDIECGLGLYIRAMILAAILILIVAITRSLL